MDVKCDWTVSVRGKDRDTWHELSAMFVDIQITNIDVDTLQIISISNFRCCRFNLPASFSDTTLKNPSRHMWNFWNTQHYFTRNCKNCISAQLPCCYLHSKMQLRKVADSLKIRYNTFLGHTWKSSISSVTWLVWTCTTLVFSVSGGRGDTLFLFTSVSLSHYMTSNDGWSVNAGLEAFWKEATVDWRTHHPNIYQTELQTTPESVHLAFRLRFEQGISRKQD